MSDSDGAEVPSKAGDEEMGEEINAMMMDCS